MKIASLKAQEAAALCPDDTSQQARDAQYQEAFFGRDFIRELREIDSEFLMTGNKLLSIHSMDSTSLASALFLLALAKNETRMQILEDFKQSMQTELPEAESNYYAAGAVGRKMPHPHLQKKRAKNDFLMFSGNAKFQSFIGFFDSNVAGTDTMNPLQREFLKLAQIFKSRLVTEMEYMQRVKERGLIEDRINPEVDLVAAQRDEAAAQKQLGVATENIQAQRDYFFQQAAVSLGRLDEARDTLLAAIGNSKQFVDTTFPGGSFDVYAGLTKSIAWRDIKDAVKDRLKKSGKQPDSVRLMVQANGEQLDFSDGRKSAAEISAKAVSLRAQELKAIDVLKNFALTEDDMVRFGAVDDSLKNLQSSDLKVPGVDQLSQLVANAILLQKIAANIQRNIDQVKLAGGDVLSAFSADDLNGRSIDSKWQKVARLTRLLYRENSDYATKAAGEMSNLDNRIRSMIQAISTYESAQRLASRNRRPLDHKRLLDMLIDDVEEKYIELLEGTRAHTANIDAYIKQIATALDDDFNTQYYFPAFTEIRNASRYYDVSLGQVETTNVLANNRGFAKVEPQATMEFDLPKRDILINEAMNGALAMTKDFGALLNDPTFLAASQLRGGQPTSSLEPNAGMGVNSVRNVLPGLSRDNDEKLFSQQGAGRVEFGASLEALIPDPAVYKFETGTGFEIRPTVQPDGQSVVFHFNYMYTTNIREPVRADEKHLGRVKRHFIDTDVQLGNYELREVSRYQVGLKASRTSRGVPLFEDIPGLGILFRPLPSAESSLQENIVLAQSTIFPTLFDLMGLRWAPAVADLDTLRLKNDDFVVRGRARDIANKVFDISASQVDEFMRTPEAERRPDLYRTQRTISNQHPDGYNGPGLNYQDSHLQEGYDPTRTRPKSTFTPGSSREREPAMPEPTPMPVPDDGILSAPVVPMDATIMQGRAPSRAPASSRPPAVTTRPSSPPKAINDRDLRKAASPATLPARPAAPLSPPQKQPATTTPPKAAATAPAPRRSLMSRLRGEGK